MSAGNLVHALPALGFVWPGGLGSPRVLRTNQRDAAVWSALAALAGVPEGRALRRRDALPVLEFTFGELAVLAVDGQHGLHRFGDVVSWLFCARRTGRIPLASAINSNTWVELVMRVVDARVEYRRTVAPAIQAGNERDLSGFAREVDNLWPLVREAWARDATLLMMMDEPDLFGETTDWDGDEEDWDPSLSQTQLPSVAEAEDEDVEMTEVTVGVGNLAVTDEADHDDGSAPMDLDSD